MDEPRNFDRFQSIDPHPETNNYRADLGDNNYESHDDDGMNGWGIQAHVDLPARGDPSQGLRVTVTRGSLAAEESNGVAVNITRDDSEALAVAYDATAKTLTGNVMDATTLANLKTQIDGITGTPLTTEYYGGETGTSMAEAYDLETSGGFHDFPCWLLFLMSNDVLVAVVPGTAAPSNDDESRLVRNTGLGRWVFVPAGHRCFVRRRGSNDVPGSVHRYHITGYGYPRKFG